MTNPTGWHRKGRTANDVRRAAVYASAEHRNLRKQYKVEVDAGRASCWRCGKPIPPGSKWELGHDDTGTQYRGPEHFTCNRSAAARKGARIANAKRKTRKSGGRATKLTWLQQDNHECPVCKGPVKWATSRTCSRACAYVLRKGAPKPPPQPFPDCRVCGVSLPKRAMRYCPAHQGYQPRQSTKPCATCGQPIICRQGPKTYCEPCAQEQRRTVRRDYKRKIRESQREGGVRL